MKKQLIAAICGLAAGLGVVQAQSVTVNLQATALWTDSGVYVTNGEAITINGNGNWSVYGAVNGILDIIAAGGDYYDSGNGRNVPDGLFSGDNYNLFYENGINGSLLAYIGDNPALNYPTNSYSPQTNYFQIGSSCQFVANTNGWLWLGFNDDANDGETSDNDGSANAQVFAGYRATNSDWTDTRPAVTVSLVATNAFGFNISDTNYPNSFWAIYDSSDLKNWVLVGAVTLDDYGYGGFTNVTSVPYRFYKVENGQTVSRVIGFEQITAEAGVGIYTPIANQVDVTPYDNSAGDTLANVFQYSTLPDGTEIQEEVSGIVTTVDTWSSGSWANGGTTTFVPGQGAFIVNPSSNSIPLIFAGLVREGDLTQTLVSGGNTLLSSILPVADSATNIFNMGNFISGQSQFLKWNAQGQGWDPSTYYDAADVYPYPGGWYANSDGSYQVPTVQVGEAFDFTGIPEDTTNVWTEHFCVKPYSNCN